MQEREILKKANELSNRLNNVEIRFRDRTDRGVDPGYVNQLLDYLIIQQRENRDVAVKKLKQLMDKMPASGFAKRGQGKQGIHYEQAYTILTDFLNSPLEVEDLTQILGWTVRLLKYKEGLRERLRF